MFERTRITLQILMTLVSFFGFNEAVLALRYRNTVCMSSYCTSMADEGRDKDTMLAIGYDPEPLLPDTLPDIDFHKPLADLVEEVLEDINEGLDNILSLSIH